MDCGWRNPEGVTYSFLERQKLPASKADYIEGADQPQTSGRRDALTRFAMMISFTANLFLGQCRSANEAMPFYSILRRC